MADKIQTIITAKDQASSTFKSFAGSVIAANQALELANKALRALSAPFKQVVGTGMEFTQQMATVRSISKITAKDFARLSDEAERIGATTQHTSAQAGKAMEELRRAGQGVDKVLTTTGATMDLVSAQGSDMGETAKLVAIQLNQFEKTGLTARRAVDLMNQTLSSSPMNFENLNYALQAASGTASAAGWDFEQMTAVLGTMAEKGVAGQKAGMALNAAMARLMNPTAEARKALEKYGIAMEDVNPATKDFASIVDVLNKKNVTQADLFKVLGQLQAPKFFKIIEAGGDSVREFAKKQGSANTALQSAKERMDSLTGDVTLLKSGLDGLSIAIFKSMESALRSLTQSATGAVQAVTAFVKENQGPLTSALNTVRQSLGYVLIGFGTLLKAVSSFLKLEGVQSFFKSLGETFDLVFGEAKKLFDEISKYIQESAGIQKAIGKLKESWNTIFEVIGKVISITGKLTAKFLSLGAKVFKPVMEDLLPLYNLFLDFANKVLKVVLDQLEKLDKALDFPVLEKIAELLDTTKESVDNAVDSFRDFDKQLQAGEFKNAAKSIGVVYKELGKVEKQTESTAESYYKMYTQSNKASKSLYSLTQGLQGVTKSGKDTEDQLVTHSTVPAIQALADVSKIAGEDAIALGKSLLKVTDDAKKVEDQAKKSAKAIGKLGAGDKGSGMVSGIIDLSGITSAIVKGFKDGAPKALKVMAAVGSIVYDAMSAAASVVSDAFGRNEKFQTALSKITDAIDDVLGPLIEEFIPVVESVAKTLKKVLGPVVKAIMPLVKQLAESLNKFLPQLIQAVMPIIQEIIGRILPVFIELVEEIMPVIIEIMDALLPIIKGIMDILVPILRALTPLIKAILEIVVELLPILELIIEIIKPFIPIIVAAIRVITLAVVVIKNLIQALKVVGQFVYDGIKNGLIAGTAIALAPLLLVLKGLEATLNIIKAPLATLGGALEDLKDAIEDMLGGAADAVTGGGSINLNPIGKGPVTGIPGSPFHDGGLIKQSDLLRLPGMSSDEGLIRAKAGEEVLTEGQQKGINLVFNISAIDPQGAAEEIRQVIEELSLTGRLKLA